MDAQEQGSGSEAGAERGDHRPELEQLAGYLWSAWIPYGISHTPIIESFS